MDRRVTGMDIRYDPDDPRDLRENITPLPPARFAGRDRSADAPVGFAAAVPPVTAHAITHPPCVASARFGPASGGRASAAIRIPVACFVREAELTDARGRLVSRVPLDVSVEAGDMVTVTLGEEDLW